MTDKCIVRIETFDDSLTASQGLAETSFDIRLDNSKSNVINYLML